MIAEHFGGRRPCADERSMDQLNELLSETAEAARHREQSTFDIAVSPFENRLVLFGAGGFGRYTLAGLRRLGITPLAFADNNRQLWGGVVDGLRVIHPKKPPADLVTTPPL